MRFPISDCRFWIAAAQAKLSEPKVRSIRFSACWGCNGWALEAMAGEGQFVGLARHVMGFASLADGAIGSAFNQSTRKLSEQHGATPLTTRRWAVKY